MRIIINFKRVRIYTNLGNSIAWKKVPIQYCILDRVGAKYRYFFKKINEIRSVIFGGTKNLREV